MKKTIILGVCGSVAAFKAVQVCSDLVKLGYDVEVIMTRNAMEFVQPLSFESLTHKTVYYDTFQKTDKSISHVHLNDKANLFLVVGATANFIGKVASGICDDMLTTTFMACDCAKVIAYAMNTKMVENSILKDKLQYLKQHNIQFINPVYGSLACGVKGKGKLADVSTIVKYVEDYFNVNSILKGKKIAISLGACQEPLDPVRYITNHSSGKMGVAIAKQALRHQMDVDLVVADVSVELPNNTNVYYAKTAMQMMSFFKENYQKYDVIVMCAAICDYRPSVISEQKIKKDNDFLTLELVKNPDILQFLGEHKKNQFLVGFAMESENLKENALKKLKKKNCDLLVANNIQCGVFKSEFNEVLILSKTDEVAISYTTKDEISEQLLDIIAKEFNHVTSN